MDLGFKCFDMFYPLRNGQLDVHPSGIQCPSGFENRILLWILQNPPKPTG